MIIEQLEGVIKNKDNPLDEIISRAALKLDKNIITTINFIFWLCYMAEQDLDYCLQASWKLSKVAYPVDKEISKLLLDKYKIKIEKIDPDVENYLPNKITFGDRIAIYESMAGKTDSIKMFWKLKKLRDCISHGRIDGLKYNNNNLYHRETQERLLLDYFNLQLNNNNLSKSKIWNDLTEEDKKEVIKNYEQLKNKINL